MVYPRRFLAFKLLVISTYILKAQCSSDFSVPIFEESFGSGIARLGPDLNQDPMNDVHPDFRPADLYDYEGLVSIDPDEYGLVKNPKDVIPSLNPGWNLSFLDHTPDNTDGGLGYMYYGDASNTPKIFYAQKINGLCDDIFYELSAWFANTNPPNFSTQPDIELIIDFTDENDVAIPGFRESKVTGALDSYGNVGWVKHSLVFRVPSGTENVYFMLRNNVGDASGNDLAIDDIMVSTCAPTGLSLDADVPVFTTGVDSNNQDFQLIANATSIGFSSPSYQFQKSADNGISWVDITITSNNVLTVNADSYKHGELYRVIVFQSTQNRNPNCEFIIGDYQLKINAHYNSCPINGQAYARFDLDEIKNDIIGSLPSSTAILIQEIKLFSDAAFTNEITTQFYEVNEENTVIIYSEISLNSGSFQTLTNRITLESNNLVITSDITGA